MAWQLHHPLYLTIWSITPTMTSIIRTSAAWLLLLACAQNALAVTPGPLWKDSYSVNGQCYCDTTYDHEAADIVVETPAGNRTVKQICETIGPGPGAGDNPAYNDVQCGNGPPNNAIDEVLCPGRVDMGADGCQIIGPTWNLELFFPDPNATDNPVTEPPTTELPQGTPPPTTETTGPETETEPAVTEPTSEVTTDTNHSSATSLPDSGTTIQPVGLAIAASDFSSSSHRWTLVDAQSLSNSIGPDSDGPHTNSAFGGKYLELLPDTKVTMDDVATSDNVWPVAGEGPQVHFDINIAQAGTYAVYLHAFSTNEFDDTIHVGFDGLWPESGNTIHTCGTRGKWIWTKCTASEPATITIPTSGVHSIQFAARDDGFEFDQFVLQRLNFDGTPAVQPPNELQAQNGIEALSQTNSELAANATAQPELGEAVLVGAGSIGFASAPIAYFVLLISGLCLLLHRFDATPRTVQAKVRSGR